MSDKVTNESMVFYKSAFTAAELMFANDAELWREAVTGLLEYGFTGQEPCSDNPLLAAYWLQAIPSIRGARERYALSREYGSRGGRPSNITDEQIFKLKAEGLTNKEIAERLGCSQSAIENRITRYNRKKDESNAAPMGSNNLISLPTEELEEIVRAIDNRVKYKTIQFKFALAEPVTHRTREECCNILRARRLFTGDGWGAK